MADLLFRKLTRLMVTKLLRIGKGATMEVVNADNSVSTLSLTELGVLDGLLATTAEINRSSDVSTRLVAGGSSLSVTEAAHDGKTLLWDTAAGTAFTLPASSGSGARFRFVVSVTATSNSHTLACVGTDEFGGSLTSIDTDTADATLAWAAEAADNFDTVTFNRTTTGLAAVGDWVEVEDVVTGTWAITGVYRASGIVATPFSSAV